ncbi:MAG: hypothetical protein J6J17_04500 [Bacilli bacterium]|nr:hypothetical protein [Bacilli bacterium]
MKVESYLGKIVVYLFDKDKYTSSDIKGTLIKVFDELNKYYNYEFSDSYNLSLYTNKYYGMILEITENDNNISDYNIVNLELNILKDTLFLYEVDEVLDYLNNEIYYYEDKFYINIKKLDINLLENSNIIYGNDVYKIIGKGIKI